MGKRKTELTYHIELIEAHNALKKYPDSRALQNTVDKIKERWANSVAMVFYMPANEKLPYTEKELGFPCKKMPTKKESGNNQTGDIVCYLPEYDINTRLLWERKGGKMPTKCYTNKQKKLVFLDQVNYLATDWYGTMLGKHDIKGHDNKVIKEENLTRFIRECDRAKAYGYDALMVGIESTLDQFLAYRPNGNVGASPASRLALSESVWYRSGYFTNVRFYGSRENAIAGVLKENRRWIKSHYIEILKLED